MEYDGKFYIGRGYDLKTQALQEPVLYDPDDLTTHGVVVGMTGSGKTGLCVDILEEAALRGIPALLVDPKGDLTNLLLHFPNLAPEDFLPWVDPDQARREGKSVEQLATEVAELWSKGLDKWDITSERIDRVRRAVDYAIYTPGSDAGFPVSILASLEAPSISWDENRELLREKISGTVTAVLGLVGIEADPVRSREHILLANIFEDAWQAGRDLNMLELIRQVQNPPFEKLGALEVEQFYPAEDRFELSMALNNLLAAPAFEIWTEGTALDIQAMLWTPEGKPRQSVFYLAHLPDNERMFFVTLLLTAVEAWVRSQPGSPSLRALLYFDEVYGFLPPVANPPSKPPLLRLLKQARAFGLGLLLTTQNPVDLDYKALSNAGTWFIGKLQTEQDKARLLDGLEGVDVKEGEFDRTQVDKLISALGKRVFLLHNVHEKEPQIFHTRWAMAYLRGPITRTKLGELNEFVGAAVEVAPVEREVHAVVETMEKAAPWTPPSDEDASLTKPTVPQRVEELFLPNNLTVAEALKIAGQDAPGAKVRGLVYRPALLAQAAVRYLDRKIGLDHDMTVTALTTDVSPRGVVRWEEVLKESVEITSLDRGAAPEARFAALGAPLNDATILKEIKADFLDYIYHSAGLRLLSNPALNLVAQPDMTEEEFRKQCAEAAQEAREAEEDELRDKYKKKIERIEDKLVKEERELSEDQAEHKARKVEGYISIGETVAGFLGVGSRRSISATMSKQRMTKKAEADIEESMEEIEELKQDLAEMEEELVEELEEIKERWGEAAAEIEETVITPYKKNIHLELFGVAWIPHWSLEVGRETFEVLGYGTS
ncbi:MAG: ATP-binding protein [Anaerolineaceae bacterium]|nr:MAG: ATP-binding protein [Anaerolineaceae bacterium]